MDLIINYTDIIFDEYKWHGFAVVQDVYMQFDWYNRAGSRTYVIAYIYYDIKSLVEIQCSRRH